MPKNKTIILDIRVLVSELSKLKVSRFRRKIEASENPEFWCFAFATVNNISINVTM